MFVPERICLSIGATGMAGDPVRCSDRSPNHETQLPVASAHRVRGGVRELASVVGPLCTPLDLLCERMELARAEEGDLVAVFQSGAYGFTASPHLFLGHPAPFEVLV